MDRISLVPYAVRCYIKNSIVIAALATDGTSQKFVLGRCASGHILGMPDIENVARFIRKGGIVKTVDGLDIHLVGVVFLNNFDFLCCPKGLALVMADVCAKGHVRYLANVAS